MRPPFASLPFVASLLVSVSALAAVSASASAADIAAASRIDAVTVFPSGAEVTRVTKIQVPAGEQTLIFADLPASALPGSIRVEGKATGGLQIGSVDTRRLVVPRNDAAASEPERKRLEDELDKLKDQKAALEAQRHAVETQRRLIDNLANLPSRPAPAQGAEKAEDWGAVLSAIASGSTAAARLAVETNAQVREIDRQIIEVQKKIAAIAPLREERTEVRVNVAAGAAVDADLVVRYQVPAASWTPAYDARLATGGKGAAPKLELIRRASIQQRSGEPWTDVAVSLSTTRPTAGTAAPELRTVMVDFEAEVRPVAASAPAPAARMADRAERAASEAVDAVAKTGARLKGRALPEPVAVEAQNAAVEASAFQVVFAVPGRVTVGAAGDAKRVQLAQETIEPSVLVRTTPKVDPKAYLYAKLVLPKSAPLLAGAVSIFRDGTFVGSGRLPQLAPGEDHELGFGADDAIKVKYAVVDEKRGETGLISSSKTEAHSFRISVKNLHDRAMPVTVIDQIPVSQNQEIKVDVTGRASPTKKDVDDKRGVVAFEQTVAPDEEKVLEFGYRITWPAARNIWYGSR